MNKKRITKTNLEYLRYAEMTPTKAQFVELLEKGMQTYYILKHRQYVTDVDGVVKLTTKGQDILNNIDQFQVMGDYRIDPKKAKKAKAKTKRANTKIKAKRATAADLNAANTQPTNNTQPTKSNEAETALDSLARLLKKNDEYRALLQQIQQLIAQALRD